MKVQAPIKVDRKTKRLAKRLTGREIAVINHVDIDEVAANSLVEGKIKLVINVGEELFHNLAEGQIIEVIDGNIYRDGELLGSGEVLDKQQVSEKLKKAYENLSVELDRFIDNTIDYAKKEKGFILGEVEIPHVKTNYANKHVLIVVRGQDYKQDLSTIISYIEEMKPILVGVDGGADALLEFGYTPDVIVGDMDSVSDEALKKAKEIIVHAYTDGRAPGLKRVNDLGLDAIVFPAPGTSEDIAMLIAYEYKAELIVALGTH